MDIRKYDVNNLGTFKDEWSLHKGCQEWWYCTGFFETAEKRKYSYQFTLINMDMQNVSPKILMLALTDLETGEHHYSQIPSMTDDGIILEQDKLVYHNKAVVDVLDDGILVKLDHKSFALDLKLDFGKGAFWHCDNGKLFMGTKDEKETTYYYSYTNMPTTGELTLKNDDDSLEKYVVTGNTWFDKQGGTYETKKESNWEWFSLRFFDNEEIMLFTFPVANYVDGTYIKSDCTSQRLNDYAINRQKIIEVNEMKWSSGWDLYMPGIKDEYYTITPYFEGNINFAYFEELCSIKDKSGKEVGMCFVELLPFVLNDRTPDNDSLMRPIEY